MTRRNRNTVATYERWRASRVQCEACRAKGAECSTCAAKRQPPLTIPLQIAIAVEAARKGAGS